MKRYICYCCDGGANVYWITCSSMAAFGADTTSIGLGDIFETPRPSPFYLLVTLKNPAKTPHLLQDPAIRDLFQLGSDDDHSRRVGNP